MSHEIEEDSKDFIAKLDGGISKLDGVERYMLHKSNSSSIEQDIKLSMHKSNSSNLEQDIKLSMEVKRYPSLYDKRDHGYKRNDPSMESWALVAKACDWIPNAEEACRLFEVLKKRYSKKKMDFRRANYFANSSELMRKTKEELDKYQFMSWMEPHIRHRTVKLGKDSGDQEIYDPDDESDINVVDSNDIVVLSNTMNRTTELGKRKLIPLNEQNQLPSQVPIVYPVTMRERDESCDDVAEKDESYVIVPSSDSIMAPCPRTLASIEPISPCIRTVSCSASTSYNHDRRSYENGTTCTKKMCTKQPPLEFGKTTIWKGTYPNYSPLRVSSDYYEAGTSLVTNPSSSTNTIYQGKFLKDEDELFSEMVLNEIRKLDGKEKCVAKHEIVNVLFNAQLKQYEKKKEEGYSSRT